MFKWRAESEEWARGRRWSGLGERFGKAIRRLRAVEQKAAKETKEMMMGHPAFAVEQISRAIHGPFVFRPAIYRGVARHNLMIPLQPGSPGFAKALAVDRRHSGRLKPDEKPRERV